MRVILEIVAGDSVGRRISLRESYAVVVGRTDDADFVVPGDSQISRTHFRLTVRDGACHLQDLQSSNGTFVNEERVSDRVLLDADQVRVGQTTFRVTVEGGTVSNPALTALAPQAKTPVADTAVIPSRYGETRPPKPTPPPVERPSFPPYPAGLADADPLVRREVLLAAAWQRAPWLLGHCRKTVAAATGWCDEGWFLAALGGSEDLAAFTKLAASQEWGPARWLLLGVWGHPAAGEMLLAAMRNGSPREAVLAGRAYFRLTGHDVLTGPRVELPPEEGGPPDAFEQEFAEEGRLPDIAAARAHWHANRATYEAGTRFSGGRDISGPPTPEMLAALNFPAQYAACLRGQFRGEWSGGPPSVFPPPRA